MCICLSTYDWHLDGRYQAVSTWHDVPLRHLCHYRLRHLCHYRDRDTAGTRLCRRGATGLSADPKPYLNPDPETLNEQAVRVKPDLAGGWSNAASALMQLGRFREAAAKQEQALRLKPSSAAYAAALAQMERLAAGESAVPVPGQKKPEGIGWSEVGAGSLSFDIKKIHAGIWISLPRGISTTWSTLDITTGMQTMPRRKKKSHT